MTYGDEVHERHSFRMTKDSQDVFNKNIWGYIMYLEKVEADKAAKEKEEKK